MHLSVCAEPIYIEAREILTKKDWIGSDSLIIHRVKNTDDWAFGLSKNFGSVCQMKFLLILNDLMLRFVCLKHLNNNQNCTDFETRFCCPTGQVSF